jgi:hypothetical protein
MNDMWLTRGNNTNIDLNTFTIKSQNVITIMYEETKKHNLFPAVTHHHDSCPTGLWSNTLKLCG